MDILPFDADGPWDQLIHRRRLILTIAWSGQDLVRVGACVGSRGNW